MIDEPVRGRLADLGLWQLPGIDQARARLRGLLPRSPLSHLTGLRLTQVGPGSATVTMPASPWLQAVDGSVEVRILLEEALAVAVTTGAPPGQEVRTATLSINQLRFSAADGDTFVARARTLNTGSLFTLAEAQVEDGAGRAVAHATASFLILPTGSASPPHPLAQAPVEEPAYTTPDPYLRPLPQPFPFNIFEQLDGLTVAKTYMAGDLPPFPAAALIGVRVVDVDVGTVRWAMPTSQWLCGRSPDVSPGVLATLAGYALAGAQITLAPVGYWVGNVEQNITLVRPVPPDGRHLLSHGTVIHHTGDLVVSTVEVTDADGDRVALGYQTGVRRQRRSRPGAAGPERVLATVLFTDIVGSTAHARDLGDNAWRNLLDEHHAAVRKELTVFKGREVKTTGDGFLATFDSPGRAVQAARAIRDSVRRLGLEVRAGLHTGECELSATDVAGIAVHIASRVQAFAGPGEIVVTSTVRDLVTGSALRFGERGHQQLKGIDGDWQLFALAD